MLHIKLNGVTKKCSIMVPNILPTTPPPPEPNGQKVKIQPFQNKIMLHIKVKEIMNASTSSQIFCLLTPHHPPPPLALRWGSKGQNSCFSEHGQVAYQIKWNHEM